MPSKHVLPSSPIQDLRNKKETFSQEKKYVTSEGILLIDMSFEMAVYLRSAVCISFSSQYFTHLLTSYFIALPISILSYEQIELRMYLK